MKQVIWLSLFVCMLFSKNIRAQDWPNLSRYASENAKLGMPDKGEKRVVLMGNSITEGWVQARPDFFAITGFIGRGISGQTTPQMLIRFRDDVVDLKPAVVAILAGTNDIAGNTGLTNNDMILDNIKSMAEIASANGIQVILCSVLPAFDYPWRPGLEPWKRVLELNASMQAYAAAEGFYYLDYHAAMVNDHHGMDEDLAYDGIHPTAAGYQVMEPLLENAVEEVLRKLSANK